KLTGKPTQQGSFTFTVKVTDGFGCMATKEYTLVVNCEPPVFSPTTLPPASAGVPYNQLISITTNCPPATIASVTGNLPTGITLTGTTLSGTTQQTGTFTFTITVRDACGCTASKTYTLEVLPCPAPQTIPLKVF